MRQSIKELRESVNLSQVQFADFFGIPVSTVRSWEQGKRNPPSYVSQMMDKIAMLTISDELSVRNIAHGLLCHVFGLEDIVSDVMIDRNLCSFYIKSRDLYVDLKCSYVHGDSWFDSNNVEHIMELQKLSNGCDFNSMWDDKLKVWTHDDVQLRQFARLHKLNYVAFWCDDLSDMYDWVRFGCPDAQDWREMYSWANFETLMTGISEMKYICLTDTVEILDFADYNIVPEWFGGIQDITKCKSSQVCCFTGDVDVDDSNCLCANYVEDGQYFVLNGMVHIRYCLMNKENL